MTDRKHPSADRDQLVGRGRPPREHQFKPGQSGNPRGRPRGTRNESTIFQEILGRKIDYRSRGRTRKIPVVEGILLRLTDDALKGDIKAATFLLNRFGALVSGELKKPDLTEDDSEILNAYARRLQARQGEDGHEK